MIILDIKIQKCPVCAWYNGWVKEKFNGMVPVYCRCGQSEEREKHGRWKSPCMVCPVGDRLGWTPISDHLEEDGRWWHTSYMGWPTTSIRHDGFRVSRTVGSTVTESNKNPIKEKNFVLFNPMREKNFVLIPAGEFMMGSFWDEIYSGGDETQHRVTISKPFYMQTTPVTQGQWKAVMSVNPSRFKWKNDDNLPVENVSWEDVQRFIGKLNSMIGIYKYRLPTEAEWEYACRAGTTTRFYSGDKDLLNAGWYHHNSDSSTYPVGQKDPNAWGLYDMHGNVWEWCQDWWGDFSSGSVTDPTGPSEGLYRVVRGGSWSDNDFECRSAVRSDHDPCNVYEYVGFRLIRSLNVRFKKWFLNWGH